MDELHTEHGFSKDELQIIFTEAERQQSILDAIARPAERTLKWFEYRRRFMDESRIEGGVRFWDDNEAALRLAEDEYGVAPEYIVGIIGVETRYGRIVGKHRVIDALSTLAFDYPSRSAFFRKELTQFLLLVREEDQAFDALKGSYAGAMGYGQFIPSSYRAYAVDFDGDGVRDIWNNTTDAIGSVANYFGEHGWQGSGPAFVQVYPGGSNADEVLAPGLELDTTVGALKKVGIEVRDVPEGTAAALMRMDLAEGAEYWLGLHDYYVITRYNHSKMYALAVHQLAQAIKTRRAATLASR
jgi:membrane-bound lytic murein transglycosylase B|tara:strand:- start:422 stop:1318 length:897 start_codon:yes stop_codon:yes gene_type:complete